MCFLPSSAPCSPSPFPPVSRGKPEKYVMIGKEMCQSTEIRPIDGETLAKLKYVIKFVGNFPPLFRIYISSAREGWNLISEVERNRIMTMLWQEAISANTRRSQLNFIYYSRIFISSYTCAPLISSRSLSHITASHYRQENHVKLSRKINF